MMTHMDVYVFYSVHPSTMRISYFLSHDQTRRRIFHSFTSVTDDGQTVQARIEVDCKQIVAELQRELKCTVTLHVQQEQPEKKRPTQEAQVIPFRPRSTAR